MWSVVVRNNKVAHMNHFPDIPGDYTTPEHTAVDLQRKRLDSRRPYKRRARYKVSTWKASTSKQFLHQHTLLLDDGSLQHRLRRSRTMMNQNRADSQQTTGALICSVTESELMAVCGNSSTAFTPICHARASSNALITSSRYAPFAAIRAAFRLRENSIGIRTSARRATPSST